MASQSSFTNTSLKKLTINDLPLLCNALNPVAPKCCALGLQLGVEKANIDIIEKDNKNCQAQLCEIISERLKQDSPLTWNDIVTALRCPSVNHPDLVRHIESWYISPLELLHHPASNPQQYLPLIGERPYTIEMGQRRGSQSPVRGTSDRGHYRSQSPVRGPSDRGHYRSQSSVKGPLDRGHYRSQSPVKWPSDRGHYRSQSPVRWPSDRGHYRSQSSVRGPSDRGHYRSQSSVRGPSDEEQFWSPARRQSDESNFRFSVTKGPPDMEDYPSPSPMRGSTYNRHYLDRAAQVSPYMYPHHQTSLYQAAHLNTLSSPQPYPTTQHVLSPTTRSLHEGGPGVGGPSDGRCYQSQPLLWEPSGSRHSPYHSTEWEPPHLEDWGSPNIHPPQHTAHPNTPHTPQPYPPTSRMSAPTTRPLQRGIVGGKWDSQSYMSHGQPEASHVQSQRNSDIEPRHPPPRRFNLHSELPFTENSTSGHLAKSAHHRSPMDTFVHYVKNTYKQYKIEKNLDVLKWPPTPSKIFINLACIDWESVVSKEEVDEYTRAMVEDGNVDVIMKKKTNIDFSDIVQDLPPLTASEKVVLVEGAPGVGKSTFAWEFCRRWERGEIAQQYQLVLLLQLRDERMSRAMTLRDLIYHSSESVCQAVVEELESTFGVNTLIVLDRGI